MTSVNPHGLLKWGQAGEYNADDDRQVITAVTNGYTGLVRPATFTAGSGLTLNLGPWLAVVDCQDGTLAVVGNRNQQAMDVPAGPGSGAARTDVVWVDIEPEDATWQINLRSQSEVVNRAGISLGTLVAPSGASGSTIAGFTLTPALPSYNIFPLMRTPPSAVQGGGTYDPTKPIRLWLGAFEYSTANGYIALPLPPNWAAIVQVQVSPYIRNLASNAVMIYPQLPAGAGGWTAIAQVRWLSDAGWFTGWVAGMCLVFYQV